MKKIWLIAALALALTACSAKAPADQSRAPAEASGKQAESSAASESAPAKSESAPAQSESVQAQSESAPAQSESAPAQSESAPAQSESTPAQSESASAPAGESAPLVMQEGHKAVIKNEAAFVSLIDSSDVIVKIHVDHRGNAHPKERLKGEIGEEAMPILPGLTADRNYLVFLRKDGDAYVLTDENEGILLLENDMSDVFRLIREHAGKH